MMQIGFVDHHHARIIERGFVTEVVIRVVADLVKGRSKSEGAKWDGLEEKTSTSANVCSLPAKLLSNRRFRCAQVATARKRRS